METIFKNKVALVIGGASGIGRATALAFAKKGANMAVVDRKENIKIVDFIKKLGSEAIFINCDVSKSDDVKAMLRQTIGAFGRLDYAFNNTGIESACPLTPNSSEQNGDKTIAIYLKGVWLCMKYEIPKILKQGKGAFVNCASVVGLVRFLRLMAHVAFKQGIVGLPKTTDLECATQEIRINVVCQDVIQTAMVDRLNGKTKEAMARFKSFQPIGGFGLANKIANAVVWMCADAASLATGM